MKLRLLKILNIVTVGAMLPIGFLSSCSSNQPTVQKVNVTLNANGGSITRYSYQLDKGTAYSASLFNTPTRTDYRFSKWTFADGSDIPTDYKFENDVTLYAQWIAIEYVTITLNLNGGSGISTTQKIEKNTTYTNGMFGIPKKTSCSFDKWTLTDGTEIKTGYKFESAVTIYAQWTAIQYVTITLDPNGGTLTETTKIVEKNTYFSQVSLPTPTLSGYTFKRWTFTDGSTISSTYPISSDVTFKAYYEKVSDPQAYIDALNIESKCSNGYLFEASYDTYTSILSNEYTPIVEDMVCGKCSSFYKNGYVGRNFEWTYSDVPEMVVHTPNKDGKYATVGVAYCSGLTKDTIKSTSYINKIKNIPNYTVDGINENGLFVSINEVPIDENNIRNYGDGSTTKTQITELALVRYLLDYAKDIEDAQEKIKNVNVVGLGSGYNEMHLMLADTKGCAEIEFVPKSSNTTYKEPKFFTSANSPFINIITNFGLNGYTGDCSLEDGKEWYLDGTSLSSKAEGCERYCILVDKLKDHDPSSFDDVLDIMSNVYYTNSYSNALSDYSKTFWFSEFNYGSNSKTTAHTVANYQGPLSHWSFNKSDWDEKKHSRTGKFWCTINSCAYDIVNKQLKLVFEEKYPIDMVFSITR